MVTVIWGASKHKFKDIEELKSAYPRLNNRPKYLNPKKVVVNHSDLHKSTSVEPLLYEEINHEVEKLRKSTKDLGKSE